MGVEEQILLKQILDQLQGSPTTTLVDIIDKANRILGVVYGSQGAQLQQRAATFELLVQLMNAGVEIDPRDMRALTSADVVNVSDRAARLLGVVYGSQGAQLQQDVSRYLTTIDIIHSKIHQGYSFHVGDLTLDVDIASPKTYLIITPDTSARAHIVFVVESEPGVKYQLFEDTTVTANGTALSLINYKRDSSTTPVLQIFKDPTVTADGTQIFIWQSGTTTAGGKVGGNIAHEDEFILKQNAKYEVKITPLSNNTVVFIHYNWYEIIP